jgi:xanthine dehydrogenase accessory factor
MRDILSEIERWHQGGESIALATVTQTWGSSPRRVGAKMALTLDGKIAGSVSGGCVENEVLEAGIDSLRTYKARLLHFGVADDDAWAIGLACGGSLDVFVKPLDPVFFRTLRTAWLGANPAVLLTIIRGPAEVLGREILLLQDGYASGTLGPEWDQKALQLGRQALLDGTSSHCFMLTESVDVFLEFISPPPTLIVLGGVHIAIPLTSLAKTLGYHTVVIDPRHAWGNAERFPNVDQLVQAWPEEAFRQVGLTASTAVAMLTHDPKLDDLGLKAALESEAFYVGALGSRTTQAKRRARLLQAGLTETQLSRLHAPIGFGIAAETPEEIALAIMAEVVDAHRRPRMEVNKAAENHKTA